jgi:hypothetical protein
VSGEATKRLNELKTAADEYFASEKTRLQNQYDFLDAISKKRGGTVGLQDANAEGASKILADSISDYLGKPSTPSGGG